MRYRKRLVNEAQDLTRKLADKGLSPYHRNRLATVQTALDLLRQGVALDVGSEHWSSEHAAEWQEYLAQFQHCVRALPKCPKAKEQ